MDRCMSHLAMMRREVWKRVAPRGAAEHEISGALGRNHRASKNA